MKREEEEHAKKRERGGAGGEKMIQPLMAQGRNTKIFWMIKWIQNRRLSIKNSLSDREVLEADVLCAVLLGRLPRCQHLPRQSLERGLSKIYFPLRPWFSKVKIVS